MQPDNSVKIHRHLFMGAAKLRIISEISLLLSDFFHSCYILVYLLYIYIIVLIFQNRSFFTSLFRNFAGRNEIMHTK